MFINILLNITKKTFFKLKKKNLMEYKNSKFFNKFNFTSRVCNQTNCLSYDCTDVIVVTAVLRLLHFYINEKLLKNRS